MTAGYVRCLPGLVRRGVTAGVVALGLAVGAADAAEGPRPSDTAPGTPVSFELALRLAEVRAAELTARSARASGLRSAAMAAGELPDPKLVVGIDNLPIEGADAWNLTRDPMTMQRLGVMQEVPNADKRRARTELAEAATARADAEREVERLRVRREAATAWLVRYYAERRFALLGELERENRLLSETVRAQVAAGRGMPAETVMPRQEALMIAERRDELEREVAMARAQLRRWIGAAAEGPLAGDPPSFGDSLDHLSHKVEQHPEVTVFDPMLRMAQAEVKEAQAMKKPDWGVELAYQRRPQYGDMMSLLFRIDLPVFGDRRQEPQIQARRAELDRLEAEREALVREHAAMVEADLAEYRRLTRAIERQATAGVPLASEKADLMLASYRAGRGELAGLLAARRELIEARLRQVDLQAQRAALGVRLAFAYEAGPR